jgi:biopolymer transport protein ExbD
MNFAPTSQEEPESVPLAPLIDIVFLTLVFFMVTSVYSTQESEIDITLPTASTAQPDERMQGEIFINLRADGQIILNGREVEQDELQGILDRVATYFPGGSVIIRGDREADLGHAIAILDSCKKADIQNVSFAALPPEHEDGL